MISCVMPTFNQANYLRSAIDSILAQRFTDFELIVVDDGSTDSTMKILASYDDPRLRVFWKPNGGTGTALNFGFRHALGEYETWFASDNVMYPNNFEELLRALTSNDCDLVFGDMDIVLESGEKIRPLNDVPANSQEILMRDHVFRFGVFWLWKKELREKSLVQFSPMPCEDLDMMLRFSENGKFQHVANFCGYFLNHSASMGATIARNGTGQAIRDAIYASSFIRRGIL